MMLIDALEQQRRFFAEYIAGLDSLIEKERRRQIAEALCGEADLDADAERELGAAV